MAGSLSPMMPAFSKNPVVFLKEVKAELTKVVWPTRQQVIQLTIIVVAVSLLVGIYIGGLDFAFTKMTDLFIKK
jgi:preprotein translocase subunit SecE